MRPVGTACTTRAVCRDQRETSSGDFNLWLRRMRSFREARWRALVGGAPTHRPNPKRSPTASPVAAKPAPTRAGAGVGKFALVHLQWCCTNTIGFSDAMKKVRPNFLDARARCRHRCRMVDDDDQARIASMITALACRGLPRGEIARRTGFSRSTIWRAENGLSGHLHDTARKLESALEKLLKAPKTGL
jgi:hypothetical protein